MQPSRFQQPILDAVQNDTCNIVIDAKAGSGKTSTLKMIVNVLPNDPSCKILLCAFNKSIQQELRAKLPQHVEVATCHSKGIEIIRRSTGNVTVDDAGAKMKEVLQKLCAEWGLNPEQGDEQKQIFDNVRDLIDLCRLNLATTEDAIREVAERHSFVLVADEPAKVLRAMRVLASNRGIVDFTDMVFLPAIFNDYEFPKYDMVLVDECQDLNVAQQTLVFKMLKPGGRFVAVGDPKQAIYSFAGADAEAFQKLTARPNTKVMPLNECYRCGKKIIEYVNPLVPDITAYADNPNGEVRDASVNELKDGDFVLCRLTLPLVMLCYKLISENRAAYVKGRDIGKNLVTLIRKSNRFDLDGVEKYMDGELQKLHDKLCKLNPDKTPAEITQLSSYMTFDEKVKVIKLIIANNGTVVNADTLCQKIEAIFTDIPKGGICLSTIHKSKGLEAERVFILERETMPLPRAKAAWEVQQEKNLEYVAYTRAKLLLGFITDWSSRDYKPEERPATKLVQKQVPAKELPF